MLDGPFKSQRLMERLYNVEGVLLLLFAVGGLIYLGVLDYEFFITGHIFKFAGFVVVGLALFGLAARSSSLLGLLPLLAFVFVLRALK
jgi:hypothetical protein